MTAVSSATSATSSPNCDNGPTKTLLTSQFDEHHRRCFGKRPVEELYRVDQDPVCVRNLTGQPDPGKTPSAGSATRWR